ncbi:MAG TPA: flagellar basal body rod protein FlgB [Nevskiaceae bacterium]|nr:flagellar basal body rod protein FlgB [Nevskiaceae bacterium]
MSATDELFGIHAAALQVQSRRMELIASNIANADTPHYSARDIDFAKALDQIANQAQLPAQATHPAHLPVADPASSLPVIERTPMQNSSDGNTVDVQTEQAQFADAALHYQASMNFVDARLRALLTAITGQ